MNIKNLIRLAGVSCITFSFYLLLTMLTGRFGLWSLEELIVGSVFSVITALLARNVLFERDSFRMLNPLRWVLFLLYLIGPFFWAMAKANLDVAYRVITGNINPGIVKLEPDLETDLGITLLANSITLTPGTLSVDVEDESGALYVHWINVTSGEPEIMDVCGEFPKWARRIAE